MTHIPALLALTVTSALLGLTVARASIHCSWTKVSSNDQLHVSFLRGDPHGSAAAPRLYHGVWSRERALLGCTWSDDAALIQSYLSACRGRTREFNDRAGKTLDLESLFGADRCVSLASPRSANLPERTAGRHVRSLGDQGEGERSEVRSRARVKRGFIVPGTLWCGSGNKAPSYADLGVFSDTDSCCREHDQCKHTILSFQSDFGVFNSNIFTMSHCDCDNKFRSCLMVANDSIADMVGYTFFNLLKMHCFTFSHRLQCAERNWFGMCKKTQMAQYADVHSPTLYESSEYQEACVNSSCSGVNSSCSGVNSSCSGVNSSCSGVNSSCSGVNSSCSGVNSSCSGVNSSCSGVNSTASARLQETNTSRPHLHRSTDTAPASSAAPAVTAAADAPNSTVAEASASTARRDDLGNVVPSRPLAGVGQHKAVTEEDRSCILYKELDECKNKILPQQRKYGLHNTEKGTLYHCNCTARLFHSLTQQRQLSKVDTLLIGYVSQSCFLPQDCTSSSSCTATMVKAELPRLDPTSVEVAEQRHLQAERRKGRRPGAAKAKRKDGAVRLYKLCVRMTRPKQTGKNKKRVQSTEPPRLTGTRVN